MARQVANTALPPFAVRLRAAQREAGFESTEELARRSGVSLRLLQKYRSGSVLQPRKRNVALLEEALGCDLSANGDAEPIAA